LKSHQRAMGPARGLRRKQEIVRQPILVAKPLYGLTPVPRVRTLPLRQTFSFWPFTVGDYQLTTDADLPPPGIKHWRKYGSHSLPRGRQRQGSATRRSTSHVGAAQPISPVPTSCGTRSRMAPSVGTRPRRPR